jgi:hypothetical protein
VLTLCLVRVQVGAALSIALALRANLSWLTNGTVQGKLSRPPLGVTNPLFMLCLYVFEQRTAVVDLAGLLHSILLRPLARRDERSACYAFPLRVAGRSTIDLLSEMLVR